MRTDKKMESFIYYANLASNAERAKRFSLAEDLWNKAALYSSNGYNIEWAYNRMSFCKKQKDLIFYQTS
ncbi:ANR family transcriptional regulator [Salmonella enterica subsp. enterica]|uniref:ANR family transcriptional regulator n=2 Tax=Salmonella enterica TaxID=28901 RepID=A0A8F6RV88_SALET|nr:ANR family transcriptional regulator [Salmonella enterica]EDQ0929177.1 ANR family transcriptional regulator [Salmonella enterica subsp. enterica serovar Anatum]EDW7342824.1 ANR family transcriptional regulator [Salmonella enterica subsp. enterica serovar London]EEB7119477.1 ANR family transcriptional regulator [Salmonella enterica subsp. enterica serovar Rubislaw]AUM33848.1 hypothetical protein LM70_24630 [Salmonella enterica subsp. enterica serovar Give]EAA9273597.1 ANR family transcriptio